MIKTIGHAAFDCYQFEKTLDFYTRVLGFEEMFNLYNDEGALWIVYLRVSDESYLELSPKLAKCRRVAGRIRICVLKWTTWT